MIDRRQLGLSAAGLVLAAALPARKARAELPMLLRIANAAGINDPQQIFCTAGRHPRLGFYQAEGVDFELVNVANPSQGMQSVATGETTLASLSPGIFLPVVARDPSFPVIAPIAGCRAMRPRSQSGRRARYAPSPIFAASASVCAIRATSDAM